MRILAGRLKGRELQRIASSSLRPTGDKVRMALTNTLRGRLDGAKILDLFCGTGAVGLEFLSNGAKSVVFFDSDPKHLNLARRNAQELGEEEQCTFIQGDFLRHLVSPAAQGPFDIIFADPPYGGVDPYTFLATIKSATLLNPGGIIILEIRAKSFVWTEAAAAPFRLLSRRVYGDSEILSFGV